MKDTKSLTDRLFKNNETILSNIKNPDVFNLDYVPNEIYIRKELEVIADYIVKYVLTGIPNNLIVYGNKGSGKTTSILNLLNALKDEKKLDYVYLNALDNPTSYKLFEAIAGKTGRGYALNDTIQWAKEKLTGRYVVVIDEVDVLKDNKILYYLSRETRVSIILLTQKLFWFNGLEESIKSSLQPIHINFKAYEVDEIKTILEMRAKEGLNKYEEGGLNLMSAVIYRDYNSDVRVGIRALYLLGQYNEWNDENTNRALEQAYKEVEYSVIKNLKDTEVIIIKALIKENNTNKAYNIAENYMNEILGYSIKKRQYFNIIHDLNNLGLFNIVRKREGRYYTLEVQMLMPDTKLIQNELKNRFSIKE
jgi:cell division control protein 6